MSDKCKKKKSTLDVCDDLRLALDLGLLIRQNLRNFVTDQRRERIVLHARAGDLPIRYCPFCRIDIAIPSAKETP